MSATENKALLEHVYRRISTGDPAALIESLADDVRWTIIGSTALSGVREGKGAVIETLLLPLRARLDDGPIVFEIDRLIAEGDHVVMQARGHATSRAGRPYDNTYCIVARIEDGRIKEMTDYVDTELITAVLGR